jgi:hypothetical protein
MSKKPIKQDDEWGNIELPGLSDEELLNTNWNHVAAARSRAKDPVWQKKQKELAERLRNDPKHAKRASFIAKNLHEDEQYKEKYLQGIRDRNQSKTFKESLEKRNADPEYQSKLKKGIQNRKVDYSFMETDDYKLNLKLSMQEVRNRDDYKEKRKSVGKKNSKKIMTPDGIFPSRKAAAEYYKKDPAEISLRMHKYPEQYYYIEDKNG